MHVDATRRGLLMLGAAGLAGCAARAPSAAPALETRSLSVEGRRASVRVWRPRTVRGVVLFSHGAGSEPGLYAPLTAAWAAAGFLVLAPVHVDSSAHPDRARYSLLSAFAPRLADFRAVSALAAREAPGKPVAAVGHSYGSIMAAMAAGGLTDRGGVRDPSVRAAVLLSTPGVVPGLVTAQAYRTLQTPLLLMTGDADVVPGFVPDWRAHLTPFETSPAGDKFAVIRRGGEHFFGLRDAGGASPDARQAAEASLLFLRAYALDDPAARRTLAALVSSGAMRSR